MVTTKKFVDVIAPLRSCWGGKAWKEVESTSQFLNFDALDTSSNVRHRLIFASPLRFVENPNDGTWIGVRCSTQILFKRIEDEIATTLGWSSASNISTTLSLSFIAPKDLFYLGSVFLINSSSDDKIVKGIHDMKNIYDEFVEPVRRLLMSESCFDPPGFYPHDSIPPLTWELRRAAYYHMTKTKSEFMSYAANVKKRALEYFIGLGDDSSFGANNARRSIHDLLQLLENYRK